MVLLFILVSKVRVGDLDLDGGLQEMAMCRV